ncbi:helix-turn-helix transcriptional regulator [Mangrovihabitans endophyticus]|uniref:Helix-turn-helix transcriptional regulator n=1 Tax=Mangrovihabitans endophyticus TaxID=1751298 RepID=A0A8J3BWV4_9ACTN|nr:response regulator transcription factor [Mangrovihabitans endophyticus]GGK78829.1 helix-turn-helix transcriptional regulator [Mangrovihabitans endophyticus]
MEKITVAVHVTDPVDAAGLRGYLEQVPDLSIVQNDPQVRLVVAERRSAGALALLRQHADGNAPQILLGDLPATALVGALDAGLAAVISPRDAGLDRLSTTIRAVVAGSTLLPPDLVTELVHQLHRLQKDVLAPNGLSSSGLTTRELDVLRLLAEGYETAEIAARLNWAERTVKNIVRVINTREHLNNRSHAVSWALRNGLI